MNPSTPGDDKDRPPRTRGRARENYRKSGPITTGKEASEVPPSESRTPHWLRYLLRTYEAEEARKKRRKKLRGYEIPETRDPPPPPAEEPPESGHE